MKNKIFWICLITILASPTLVQGQLLTQQHKEVEYNYGIIAEADYDSITEIEKYKHGLQIMERTVRKTIHSDYKTTMEIQIDSNSYVQSWMDMATRFVYTKTGVECYGKNNQLIESYPYDDETEEENQQIQQNTEENGYHPGIVSFPVFTSSLLQEMLDVNILVDTTLENAVMLTYPDGSTETFDYYYSTITREWVDEEGYKNKSLLGYEPFEGNRGYVLRISKHERNINSFNGPCITEVKITSYTDYQIQDNNQMIEKAIGNYSSIEMYPNPSTGIFNVSVTLPQGENIMDVRIVSLLDGSYTTFNPNGELNFSVDVSYKPSGHYALVVTTNQQVISKQFFKN